MHEYFLQADLAGGKASTEQWATVKSSDTVRVLVQVGSPFMLLSVRGRMRVPPRLRTGKAAGLSTGLLPADCFVLVWEGLRSGVSLELSEWVVRGFDSFKRDDLESLGRLKAKHMNSLNFAIGIYEI